MDWGGRSRGAAAPAYWQGQPVPSTPPPGPIDSATELLLRRCQSRPDEFETLWAPLYALGDHAGQRVLTPLHLRQQGLWTGHASYQRDKAREFARRVGPPMSLLDGLALVDELGVVSGPRLTGELLDRGLTAAPMEAHSLKMISFFWSQPPRFKVLGKERWRWELVVADGLLSAVVAAEGRLKEAVRRDRLISAEHARQLADGLSPHQVVRLLEGCGWLAIDGASGIDDAPRGIDHGLGRALLAAPRQAAPTGALHTALTRWVLDQHHRSFNWTVERLAAYLELSVLYEEDAAGWTVAGGWAALTDADL